MSLYCRWPGPLRGSVGSFMTEFLRVKMTFAQTYVKRETGLYFRFSGFKFASAAVTGQGCQQDIYVDHHTSSN